jgi:hypothetical protein
LLILFLLQGDIPNGRSLIACSDGIAILESDCFDLIEFVAATVETMPLTGSSPLYRSGLTKIVQMLRHSVFPADTESFGNFVVKGPYVFQKGRLSAVRGKVWSKLMKQILHNTFCFFFQL